MGAGQSFGHGAIPGELRINETFECRVLENGVEGRDGFAGVRFVRFPLAVCGAPSLVLVEYLGKSSTVIR